MARNISLSVSDAALDECPLRFVKVGPEGSRVVHVETTMTVPGVGAETVSRPVSAIPAVVFTGASGATAKALYIDQTRRIATWLRAETDLAP